MKATKFTFRTDKSTGKWRSFYPDSHYIKLNGIDVGQISNESPYAILLRIIKDDINSDGNPNCEWRWAKLKVENKSLADAKNWLNEHFESLSTKYKFPTV